MSGLKWGLLGSVEKVDTVVPGGGHDVLDDVSLLSTSQCEPSSPIVPQNKMIRIVQGQSRYRKAEENDTEVEGELTWRSCRSHGVEEASQRDEPGYAMKGDKADLHRDTKTGLSKVSEDHPGTLGVAKSVKKNVYDHH